MNPSVNMPRRKRRLPDDSKLMPLTSGELLVSRNWAVFCRIAPEHLAAVRCVIKGDPIDDLPVSLLDDLDRHGFFDQPRQSEPEQHTVAFQLTNDCNLACSYCCTNSGCARNDELTYDEFKEVVVAAKNHVSGNGTITLLGGEPFLVPWAIDLAEYIIDLGLNLQIYSNGTLHATDEDLVRRTAALTKRGADVRISLAGPTAELCDAVSGAPRFDRVIQGVQNIAKHAGRVKVDLLLLPEHVDAVAKHLPELRRALPEGVPLSMGLLYISGRERGKRTFQSRAELERALDKIALEAGVAIRGAIADSKTFRREGCSCAMGHHLHVRSDGSLFSCFKMEEKVGHIREERFEDVLDRTCQSDHSALSLDYCSDCALATICGGGCRSENLLYTGDADLPICGPWRVRVTSELLAEDQVSFVKWQASQLHAEARARGIEAPERLTPLGTSRHLLKH